MSQRSKHKPDTAEIERAREDARGKRAELGLPEEAPGNAEYERLKAEREALKKRKKKQRA